MKYQDKSVLVIDGSCLFSPLAELLTKDFGKVGYFIDWQSGFADGRELIIGTGLKGVEKVKYLWDVVDEYDLFVFPDVWAGDLQEYLRRAGKRVWGTGKASSLELFRWKTRELMKKAGLPMKDAEVVNGMSNLRGVLKQRSDVFVKISQFRGIHETFHSENYGQVKGLLDELESKFGSMLETIPFVVEESIPDAKEIGYDGFCIDGKFPNKAFVGAEIKDKAYFGRVVEYDDLPDTVRLVNDKLSPHMEGYRQFFSTEIREQGGKGYPIDLTCRQPSPAGEPELHAMTNLAEVLYEGANGVLIEPEYSAKFVAQIILSSNWAMHHFQMVEFPDKIRPFVKLYNHAIINGKDYIVPQIAPMKELGSVIGLGNTPEEAVKMAKNNAKQIDGFDIEIECDALDEAVKLMEKT